VNPITQNFCATTDDRFLAVATDDGVHLWNLPAKCEVALAPAGHVETAIFESGGKALWTCATNRGLQRWAIQPSGRNDLKLTLGPPLRIELPFAPLRLALDRADKTLAVISQNEGQVVVLDLAMKSIRSLPVHDPMADFIALSPDANGWRRAVGIPIALSFGTSRAANS
jgi:hypothetical protein